MDVSQYLEIFIDESAEHLQTLRHWKKNQITKIQSMRYSVLPIP